MEKVRLVDIKKKLVEIGSQYHSSVANPITGIIADIIDFQNQTQTLYAIKDVESGEYVHHYDEVYRGIITCPEPRNLYNKIGVNAFWDLLVGYGVDTLNLKIVTLTVIEEVGE